MSVVSVASVNKFFMSVNFSKILRKVDDVTQVEVVNDLMGCTSLPLPNPHDICHFRTVTNQMNFYLVEC